VYTPSVPDGSQRRPWGWIGWAAASAACLLIAAFAVVFLVDGIGQVSAKPDAEIYFDDPSSIVTWTAAKSGSFTFAVDNLTGETYRYQYVVRLTGQKNLDKVLTSSSVTLEPHQLVNIKQILKAPNLTRFQVSVSLTGSKDIVFFWAKAPGSQSISAKK
jgi:hypothetical protein